MLAGWGDCSEPPDDAVEDDDGDTPDDTVVSKTPPPGGTIPLTLPAELPFIVKALPATTEEVEDADELEAAAAAAAATAAAVIDDATVLDDNIPGVPLDGVITPPRPPNVLEYDSRSAMSAPAPRCEPP